MNDNPASATTSSMPPSGPPGQRYYLMMWWAFLVLVIVSPAIIGSIGAIGAFAPVLLALPLLFHKGWPGEMRGQWGIWVFPLAFALLALIFALNAKKPGDMIFVFNFIALPLCIPAYLLARRYAGGGWPLTIAVLALTGVVLGTAIGAYDIWGTGARRAAGFANNPNMYAHIVLLLGFVALCGVFLSKSPWRFVFLVGPFLGVAASILAGSRGTLLAVPFLIIVALIYVFTRPEGKNWVAGGLLALTLLSAGGLAAFSPDDGRLERAIGAQSIITEVLEQGSSRDRGTRIRLAVYDGAWQAFLQSPIIGHGWAGAIPKAIELSNRPRLARAARSFPHMHNDFLGFAAAGGLAGILVYFAMLAAPVSGLRRSDRFFGHRLYVVTLLIVAYIIYGLFDAPMGYDIGINTFVFMTAILAGSFREDKPDSAVSEPG